MKSTDQLFRINIPEMKGFHTNTMRLKQFLNRTSIMLFLCIILVFLIRTLLAPFLDVPRLFELFDLLVVGGSLISVLSDPTRLRTRDWIIALSLGVVVGVGMLFATLFSPYPYLGIVNGKVGQAFIRGILTAVATLGGLTIMRQGGPVTFNLANGDWKKTGRSVLLGLAIGLPLAIINVFALKFSEGRAIDWQNPLAALLDALQPGIVEEAVYRFALWGLLWMILRRSLPQSAWVAGFLATLVHNYAHFDALFLQSPLMALGMGLVLALVWGLPTLILARRHGLESAFAFHWIQDVARFMAGF